ncbi:hypothetical protein Skr01_22720 [Sphaerisporangium krabiense]|uniref:Anti-sigma factor antagonist n=1 Tax=Sphaerisporangium krabiense TaxID=763782 RepID=A0A7W8Z5U9_9ACTN|nr:STAS domain-containing protein [Sphaerisporangium krabiense]MBB5628023.1 anti-sigma B factor antagonist/stage II sporulation protein AA (anti-sigma F factor antagonist) [Sphaerisporangium krabiense]GII62187.1 hypothetical protein Skr01_22720 [Sphaerisporangium krabiense]
MARLSVHTAHEQDHTTLALIGELDVLSAARLDDAVAAALDGGHHHLTVDTAALTFCDSSGLWALLRASRAAGAIQGTMALANVQGPLRRILDLTKLGGAFTRVGDHAAPSDLDRAH